MWRTSLERIQKAVTMREMGREVPQGGGQMWGQALFSKPINNVHQDNLSSNRDRQITQAQVTLRLDKAVDQGGERESVCLRAEIRASSEPIRQRPDGANMPIVAVTADAMREYPEQALRSGCTDYLAKPFRASDLLEVVRRMLSSR
jgi:DNA-binding NarL/FixJ family response regulator